MTTTLQPGRFDQNIPGTTTDLFTIGKELGGGNDGSVYTITVEPRYLTFGSPSGQDLAIKALKKNTPTVNRERDALKAFQANNSFNLAGITKSYTGFDFDGIFYFISERATGTLKELFKNDPEEVHDNKWLYQQLQDLAQALQAIHGQEDRNIGMHHDIQPDNILLFKDQDSQLKLTDWGHTALNKHQGFTKTASGVTAFSPPESAPVEDHGRLEKTARPHDIWALGRLFLELLVWVSQRKEGYDAFREEVKAHGAKRGRLWIETEDKDKNKSRFLSPAAIKAIDEYKQLGLKKSKPLALVIEGMLAIEPSERLKIHEVVHKIKEVIDTSRPRYRLANAVNTLCRHDSNVCSCILL